MPNGYGRLRSVSAARLRVIFNPARPRVIWNRRRGGIPFRWGAPALEFLEYGGTVILRVARRAPAPTRSTAALPADMALFSAWGTAF